MEDPTPLLIVLPLVGAALGRVPAVSRRPGWGDVVAIVSCASVAVIALLVLPTVTTAPSVQWVGGWEPREGLVIGVALYADTVSVGMAALAGVLTTAVSVYATGGYERVGGLFHVLTLVLLAAVNGFVLSGDLLTMFVFVELIGIVTYALTAYKVSDTGTVPAAFTIAVTSTIGAVFFLTGVTSLYGALGTPNLAEVATRVDGVAVGPSLVVAAAFVVAGLSAKAGLVPFHFSHADSHTAAMVPHAALFGALTVPAGLYGIARLLTTVVAPLGGLVTAARWMLVGAALTTAIVGAVMALVQTHLKRLLAFSSISHLGIAAVGVAVATPTALAGTMLYVVGHGLLKTALFLAVGVVLHRLGSVDLARIGGRGREVRGAVVVLAIGAAGLAGAPPSGLHLGKVGLDAATSELGVGWIMAVVYLAAILTGAALARAVVHLVRPWPAGPDELGRVAEGERETLGSSASVPTVLLAVPGLLLLAAVAVPFVPGFDVGAVVGAERFLDPAAYSRTVLDGETGALERGDGFAAGSIVPIAKGLAAGLAAVVLGIAAAWDRPGTGSARLGAPLRGLRRLHSGHVGDYVVWAAGGAAAWAAVLLVVT